MLRPWIVAALAAVLLAPFARADSGGPDPISLDRLSPSIVDFPWTGNNPANIYDMPNNMPMPPAPPLGLDAGGPGPVVHTFDFEYGLLPSDNNDGHSNGETTDPGWPQEPGSGDRLMIYFSGDAEQSKGLPGTDYENQYLLNQAAGDRFIANGITSAPPSASLYGGGPASIGGAMWPGLNGTFPANILHANQHRYNEIPSVGPWVMNPYMPMNGHALDDMDALELTAFDTTPQDGAPHDMPIYFSLDSMSTSLGRSADGDLDGDVDLADLMIWQRGFGRTPPPLLTPGDGEYDRDNVVVSGGDLAVWKAQFPGGPPAGALTGADILVSPPFMPSFQLFAPAVMMGLNMQLPNDEVDALAVWDRPFGQQFVADPMMDIALFSLAPGSPYLMGPDGAWGTADDYSAADIFVTDFSGQSWVYLQARTLGMRFEDNIDAIDVEGWWEFEQEPPLEEENIPTLSTVPEPASLVLVGLSMLILGGRRKR